MIWIVRRYSNGDMPVCLRKKRLNEDWEENPLCIPEEELAWWSIVSTNNVLRPEAQERFQKLFAQVIDKEAMAAHEKL